MLLKPTLEITVSVTFCDAESRKSSLNKRVNQLDEACRAKEAERVDLELRLTQVQENLKKSLAGGALGAPVETKPPIKAGQSPKLRFIPFCKIICLNCWTVFVICVGFQQKEEEHLQRDAAGELRLGDPEETPVCVRLHGHRHAEGKGSLTWFH